jgi:hypothetical protein
LFNQHAGKKQRVRCDFRGSVEADDTALTLKRPSVWRNLAMQIPCREVGAEASD